MVVKCTKRIELRLIRRTRASASRAILTVELESGGCNDAFRPQLDLVHNATKFCAQTCSGVSENAVFDTLLVRHVIFKRVRPDDKFTIDDLRYHTDSKGRGR